MKSAKYQKINNWKLKCDKIIHWDIKFKDPTVKRYKIYLF